LLALKGLLMTEPYVNQTPQTEPPPFSSVTGQEVSGYCPACGMPHSLGVPHLQRATSAFRVSLPKGAEYGSAIETQIVEVEELEAEFSELLAQLDASAAESPQRQAVIAELRQKADAELAALAEVVAAL